MRAAVQQLLFLVLVGGAGWFVLVRPQRRRAAALTQVREAVSVGSAVVTTAGLHARVAELDDDTVLLEIAPGVLARFNRAAVVRVLSPAEPPAGASAEPVDPAAAPDVATPGSRPGPAAG